MNFLAWISCVSDRDSTRAFQSFKAYSHMINPDAPENPENLTAAYHSEIRKGWERWAIAKAMWAMMSFWMNLRFNRYTLHWSDPGLYQWLRSSDLER